MDSFDFDNKKDYADAMQKANGMAKRSLVAAVIVMGCFWLLLFIGQAIHETHFGFPAWFWLAGVGGYLVAVASVWVVVKKDRENS
ncbi:MAG TPA: hypothetical protein DCW60_00370 [Sutterella sp.]|nr:hypothetical protein [Sutterella sp.]